MNHRKRAKIRLVVTLRGCDGKLAFIFDGFEMLLPAGPACTLYELMPALEYSGSTQLRSAYGPDGARVAVHRLRKCLDSVRPGVGTELVKRGFETASYHLNLQAAEIAAEDLDAFEKYPPRIVDPDVLDAVIRVLKRGVRDRGAN